MTDRQRMIAGRSIIAAGCCYELLALAVPRLPTISEIVHRASDHRFWRFAAWCFGGYALDHFFG